MAISATFDIFGHFWKVLGDSWLLVATLHNFKTLLRHFVHLHQFVGSFEWFILLFRAGGLESRHFSYYIVDFTSFAILVSVLHKAKINLCSGGGASSTGGTYAENTFRCFKREVEDFDPTNKDLIT